MFELWLFEMQLMRSRPTPMEYDYDQDKSRRNFEERGIDFEFTSRIFVADFTMGVLLGASHQKQVWVQRMPPP